jgi:murein L,D-transpeptidase YcbB/YkuD
MTVTLRKAVAALALSFFALCACAVREPPPPDAPAPLQPPPRAWSSGAYAELRAIAASVADQGFASEERTLATLDRLDRAALREREAAAQFDAAADVLFARLATQFAVGAVDPAEADPEWRLPPPSQPDVGALRRAVAAGQSARGTLNALLPTAAEYQTLAAELARVRAEAEGAEDAEGRSRETRIDKLRASLERWRWMPRDMPARRIDVLVPFFELRLRDVAGQGQRRAAIVGARASQTPSFAASVTTITLNPSWTPPTSIVTNELLPRFRRDPDAAAREGFDILDRNGVAIDPALVDWRARPFPYMLRQRPGAHNALGRIRFDLPNPFAVFLHDTPSRGLFARADRALSHGCIRVAEPLALAEAVLADPAWAQASLQAAIDEETTHVLTLTSPLPIFLLYLTAAADESGTVVYADDIYARDAAIVRALDRNPSRSARAAAAPATECSALR